MNKQMDHDRKEVRDKYVLYGTQRENYTWLQHIKVTGIRTLEHNGLKKEHKSVISATIFFRILILTKQLEEYLASKYDYYGS